MAIEVFISSRFEEFRHLRKSLLNELEATPSFQPIALDDGSAAPVTTTDRSLGAVERADLLVLLLGDTYAEDADATQSVTEQEFDVAVQHQVPIYAYAHPERQQPRDQRSRALLERVMEQYTVGKLSDDVAFDARRIVADLEGIDAQDEVEGARDVSGLAGLLAADLQYLGAGGLEGFVLPEDRIVAEPAYNQVIEARRFALRSLSVAELSEVRRQLERGLELFQGDWATNYLLARVLDFTRRRSDIALAVRATDRARRVVDDLAHAPATGLSDDIARARREVATLTLHARMLRLSGDASGLRYVDKALEMDERSRPALVERVQQAVHRRDVALASTSLARLATIYPDVAVRATRSADFRDLGREAESEAVAYVLGRESEALSRLRESRWDALPVRLESALERFRTTARRVTDELDTAVGYVGQLFWINAVVAQAQGHVAGLTGTLTPPACDPGWPAVFRRLDTARSALAALRRSSDHAHASVGEMSRALAEARQGAGKVHMISTRLQDAGVIPSHPRPADVKASPGESFSTWVERASIADLEGYLAGQHPFFGEVAASHAVSCLQDATVALQQAERELAERTDEDNAAWWAERNAADRELAERMAEDNAARLAERNAAAMRSTQGKWPRRLLKDRVWGVILAALIALILSGIGFGVAAELDVWPIPLMVLFAASYPVYRLSKQSWALLRHIRAIRRRKVTSAELKRARARAEEARTRRDRAKMLEAGCERARARAEEARTRRDRAKMLEAGCDRFREAWLALERAQGAAVVAEEAIGERDDRARQHAAAITDLEEAADRQRDHLAVQLGLDGGVASDAAAAEALLQRLDRFHQAFAPAPNLRAEHVPPHRAKVGDVTRLGTPDAPLIDNGPFPEGRGAQRRIVRVLKVKGAQVRVVSELAAICDLPVDVVLDIEARLRAVSVQVSGCISDASRPSSAYRLWMSSQRKKEAYRHA